MLVYLHLFHYQKYNSSLDKCYAEILSGRTCAIESGRRELEKVEPYDETDGMKTFGKCQWWSIYFII